MPLDALPDLAKYAIGVTLIVLGLFGGYIVQDTWKEPDQRSNVILRRIGYFWIGGLGTEFQIGAVLRLYSLSSRTTLLDGISLEAEQPQIQFTGGAGGTINRIIISPLTAEANDENFVKARSDANYKLLLPIHVDATFVTPSPPTIAYVGTWKLRLKSGSRIVQPQQSGTFDRAITEKDWEGLLKTGSTISSDSIRYYPTPR